MANGTGDGNGWAKSLALILFTIIFTSVVERLWLGDVVTKEEMNEALAARIGAFSEPVKDLKSSVHDLLEEVKRIEIDQAKSSNGKAR